MQFAKNAVGQLQRQESEVQLLLKIREVAFANATNGERVVDWAAVAAAVEKGSPGTKHNIQDLCLYFQKWGGGVSPETLDDLSAFFANHVPSGRVVASATFAALAALRLPPEKFMPHFVTAVVKAQATCPPSKVQQGICKYITQNDIATIAGKRLSACWEAEQLIRAGRDAVKSVNPTKLNRKQTIKIVGALETKIAHLFWINHQTMRMSANYA